jgi:hypothetical protein
LKRRDVWYVDPTANNLDSVIADAKKAILEIGLRWFSRFADMNEVLRTLLEDFESDDGTFGFGRNPSPMRHFMTGFAAFSLGRLDLARDRLKKALDSGCFRGFEAPIHAALEGRDKQSG